MLKSASLAIVMTLAASAASAFDWGSASDGPVSGNKTGGAVAALDGATLQRLSARRTSVPILSRRCRSSWPL